MEDEVTGQEQSGQEETGSVAPETGGGDSINPAWNELLEVVPSMLHSQVTPHLKKWDQNYQEGISKVHSQYEPYKPYLENNIAPEQINYALQLVRAIDERPADVISALQQYANVGQEAGQEQTGEQGQVGETEVPEWLNHPQFQRLNGLVETMAQILVQQGQTAQETQEDQMLSDELDQLHEKHGDFDERWVLTQAAMNPQVPLETHVQEYNNFVNGIIKQQGRPPGPKVLGGGGLAPDNQVDVSQLDGKGRRALIAQSLAAAAQQNG